MPENVGASLDRDKAALELYRALATTEDERKAILAALEAAGGSKSRAAEMLRMGRMTLWRNLRRYPGS